MSAVPQPKTDHVALALYDDDVLVESIGESMAELKEDDPDTLEGVRAYIQHAEDDAELGRLIRRHARDYVQRQLDSMLED